MGEWVGERFARARVVGMVASSFHTNEPIQAAAGVGSHACPGGSDGRALEPSTLWRDCPQRRRMTVAIVHRHLDTLGIDRARLPAGELYTWPAARLSRAVYLLGRKVGRRGLFRSTR